MSELAQIIETLQELERMHQLNLELLEQLNVACDWLVKHNVSFPNAEVLLSLLEKSKTLLIEMQADKPKILQYQKIPDGSYHVKKPDDKLPEPKNITLINTSS